MLHTCVILALKPPISTLEQALGSRSKPEKFRRLKRIKSIYVKETKFKKYTLILKNKGREEKKNEKGERRENKNP